MTLHIIDIVIILLYLCIMVLIGWYFQKKASLNKENYLLGGKSLPWYYLGLSNASGMFDISGTMWMVTLAFVYGIKSLWLPWLWPVFNQVFLMMYLSVWLRRSNVTTGAEWMATRFGSDKQSSMAQWIIVVFAILSCLGFLAYGFVGLGKFVEIFIPWELVSPYIPLDIPAEYVPHFYGIVFTLFSVVYAIMGGMSSIVIADVVQYVIMTVAAIAIGIIAMNQLASHQLIVPEGWFSPFFGKSMNLDWSHIIPEVNEKIIRDGYEPFSIFFTLMLIKGILGSLAGPAPNYDMQKLLSTKSPKEAAKMSGFVSVILLPTRYLMIMGFAILGLLFFKELNLESASGIDFEKILPAGISAFVPPGLVGILLAGLLAAFIGTFAGTLNAAQAYILNDIYLKYINPKASDKKVSRVGYAVGILVVVVSIALGFMAKNVNDVLQWIVGALYGGYIAANVLKWHWWRFNAMGFFWGMMTGIAAALVFPYIFTGVPLYSWPLLFLISLAGSVAGTYLSPPTDPKVLKSFYKSIRPWGFWEPIKEKVIKEDPSFRPNKRFGLDMFNVAIGIIAQCCLTLLPMYLVLSMKLPLIITITILVVIGLILKRTWWDKLED
ncbi:sodium:solute symporter family protein [Haoranjiania flava]|uniref:Na+:solute symporter n=1 Tax=Haoranjiania flava TaxID=1856322 RepID=A0AAE3IS53_9BACT|nr:sodium:solute symporter family protein [Haoranjiania flava]MCU7694787.1 Na+:solute symporter [Haoranjiania flava]